MHLTGNTILTTGGTSVGGEIALAPARVLLRPGLLEAPDSRGRKPARVLPEQRAISASSKSPVETPLR